MGNCILTHDPLNMSNETLHHLAIVYVNTMDKNGNEELYEHAHL